MSRDRPNEDPYARVATITVAIVGVGGSAVAGTAFALYKEVSRVCNIIVDPYYDAGSYPLLLRSLFAMEGCLMHCLMLTDKACLRIAEPSWTGHLVDRLVWSFSVVCDSISEWSQAGVEREGEEVKSLTSPDTSYLLQGGAIFGHSQS